MLKAMTRVKDDVIVKDGHIADTLPGAQFVVDFGDGHTAICALSGRMRKNRIRVLMGDPVTVEVSTYDLGRGRITFRHK